VTSINQKYILPFLLGLSCLAAIYIFFILNQHTNLLKTELSRKGKFVLENFAAASQVDILLKDEDRLNELIQQIVQKDEDINIASVFIKDDNLLISNDSTFTFPERNITTPTDYDLKNYLLFVLPLTDNDDEPTNIIGLVGVSISKKRLNQMIRQTGLRVGLVGLAAFAFIGYFVNYLSRRLKILVDNAIEEAKQIESAYVKLQDLQYELEETNTSLERRVLDRSAELSHANVEFKTANNELKEFAYIVSHDLKAPLRAIDSLTGWIVEDYEKSLDKEGKNLIQILKGRVTTMNQLIDGILQYSRISRVYTKREAVDLNEVIVYVWSIEKPDARFKLEIQQYLPTIFINYDKIQEAFQKIINNAIRFNDKENPIVKIDWNEDEEYIYILISDNGIGIAEKDFDEIFKIFKTLDKKQYENQIGLGLTLAKRIIDSYNGLITVQSVVGEGTTFKIAFSKSNLTQNESTEDMDFMEMDE
jgi:signal transduction histidine kinase